MKWVCVSNVYPLEHVRKRVLYLLSRLLFKTYNMDKTNIIQLWFWCFCHFIGWPDQGKWHHRGRQKSNKSVINSIYIVNDTHLTILTSYLTFEKYSTQFWGLFMCGIPGQRLLSEKINLFTLFFNIWYNMTCVRDSFFFCTNFLFQPCLYTQ